MRKLGLTLAAGGVVLATAFATAATAGDNDSGVTSSLPSMITVLDPAEPTEAIITTGETMPGGYRFEAIPDGIAVRARGQGRLDVYVNHETSTVPFPFSAPFGGAPPTTGGSSMSGLVKSVDSQSAPVAGFFPVAIAFGTLMK